MNLRSLAFMLAVACVQAALFAWCIHTYLDAGNGVSVGIGPSTVAPVAHLAWLVMSVPFGLIDLRVAKNPLWPMTNINTIVKRALYHAIKSAHMRAMVILLLLPRGLQAADFVRGADVGWLPQMEATGYVFRDAQGKPEDCLQILKDDGINTVRLRVFVNPSNDPRSGHCSPAEVVAMATRASKMGFRILVDFHYSDSWADPAKQRKPVAWAAHDLPQLLQDVHDHTTQVLRSLAIAGITPEWVQIGNEITGGMLWPEGSVQNWPQLAQLLNRGYDAVKAVNPQIKVIIHLDGGNHGPRSQSWFDAFGQRGGKYDVIGLSYYPWWEKKDYTETIDGLGANLQDLAARYGKEVMVVEVGGEDARIANTRAMLVAVQQKVLQVPDARGLGVIYWEPEGARAWSHYQLSCWGADGRPTDALRSFLPTTNADGGRALAPSP